MKNPKCICSPYIDSFSAGRMGIIYVNQNCPIHGMCNRFTPSQVRCLIGGEWPEDRDFDRGKVEEFLFEDGEFKPYAKGVSLGKGISIDTVQVCL